MIRKGFAMNHKDPIAVWWNTCRVLNIIFIVVGVVMIGFYVWKILTVEVLDTPERLGAILVGIPWGMAAGIALALLGFKWEVKRSQGKEPHGR